MPYQHPSGLPGVYDRTREFPEWSRVLFREDRIAQAAEVNEAQSIIEARGRRVAERIMRDGDRIEGAEILIDADAGTITLTAGKVYARGDVRDVAEAVLTGVPMTGELSVGIRLRSVVVTEAEEPALLGLAPGSEAEGEAGAAREVESAVWSRAGDGVPGDLFQVYLVVDGVAVDQTPPPILSGINQAIALYDRDANGSYVVRGCRVAPLGLIGGAQHFSISEGTANVNGFKRVREYALRHVEPEDPDLATVDAEAQTYAANAPGGNFRLTLNRRPLSELISVVVTKERTVTLTKGASNTQDVLPDTGVTAIMSVQQGPTTYTQGVDYLLSADTVDWSPGGTEPATGSSYNVTYRYLDAVTPVETTATEIEVSGGVVGGTVLLSYRYKLPRHDLLCLDASGRTVYVRGISAPVNPRAPAQPATLLALAEIRNTWIGPPEVVNTDVRSVPYSELWAYLRRFFDGLDLIALERLRRDIDSREPVAKKGVFVDPWVSDFYRDQGEPQTAAIFDGQMQLAIDPAFFSLPLLAPAMLEWTEEVVIRQELATGCMRVNPYANFTPLPGTLELDPPVDFWVETRTEWASDQTRQMLGRLDANIDSRIVARDIEAAGRREERIEFLREIPISFVIRGFGPGEELESLTFDGLDVTPPGSLVANGLGVVEGSFTIPANVPAGVKPVRALGAGGTPASAQWVGEGTVRIEVMRRVVVVTRGGVIEDRPDITGDGSDPGGGGGGGVDPLAQTFALPQARHIAGVDLRVCAVGDPANSLLVEIHAVENGIPTEETLAQVSVPMAGVSPGQWIQARFPFPVFLTTDREWCVMIKTDDADHALSIARVGDFDAASQAFVSAQPYSVGVLLSSSNARTWTPHQNEDLTFRLVAARFAPVERVVPLGSVSVDDMSDLLIRAVVDLPTAAASVVFEVVREDGSVTRVLPGQLWQLSSFVSETIQVRAVLTGTATVSPTLFPRPVLIAGTIRGEGTYITRAFEMGASIRMSAFVKTRLPSGSTLTVEVDAADDDWTVVAQHAGTILDDGWIEREFRVDPYNAPQGRLRLTLTGGPAARPLLADMRAVSI